MNVAAERLPGIFLELFELAHHYIWSFPFKLFQHLCEHGAFIGFFRVLSCERSGQFFYPILRGTVKKPKSPRERFVLDTE